MRFRIVTTAFFAVILGTAFWGTCGPSTKAIPRSLLPGVQPVENVYRIVMPEAVDVDALLQQDAEREQSGVPTPTRFAAGLPVSFTPDNSGTWETLDDGTRLWRLRISSPGALTLSLGLQAFDLPGTAAFWVHDPNGAWVQGPYTADDLNAAGGLWTAVVVGDELVAELQLPNSDVRPNIEISTVHHGYRGFDRFTTDENWKRGSCNVNVVCPEGNKWADQIRSVARITFTGDDNNGYLCSGQLVNNTAEDDTPYFLTAGHCIESNNEATTVVAYWNYQTASCDQFFGGSLSQNQSGATLVSTLWVDESDFSLLRLDDVPDQGFDVYYLGWDARPAAPQSTVCIHHPAGSEKSISYDFEPATITSRLGNSSPGDGYYLRVADWDIGTTEGGSSGSCLLDGSSGLCVGNLSGGWAACGNNDPDWYGRLHSQWSGGGTPETQLSAWLDPIGTGAEFLTGKNPGSKAASQTWLIPAVASVPGGGASNWKSQLSVANSSLSSRNAMVFYIPAGEDWPGDYLGGPYLIGPMGSLYLDDPLLPENPTSGSLYITVDGDSTAGFSRTINLNDDGSTFGQGMPAVLLNDAEMVTEYVLPMVHSAPGRYRTNLGFAQTSGGNFNVLVSIYSSNSVLLAERDFGISTGWKQFNNIFKVMGIGDVEAAGAWIRVQLTQNQPSFWTTYATVIDNTTNDPTYVMPVAP